MIIRRDTLVHSPAAAAMMLAAAARGAATNSSNITPAEQSSHVTLAYSPSDAASPSSTASSANATSESGTTSSSSPSAYPMSPLEQRDAMQREQWDKDREQLLKKASNSQGDAVKRMLAKYLAV